MKYRLFKKVFFRVTRPLTALLLAFLISFSPLFPVLSPVSPVTQDVLRVAQLMKQAVIHSVDEDFSPEILDASTSSHVTWSDVTKALRNTFSSYTNSEQAPRNTNPQALAQEIDSVLSDFEGSESSAGQLVVKVSPAESEEDFQPGDIVHALNQKRMLTAYAQTITNPRNFGFNEFGLRDEGTLLERYMEYAKEFKFERVSATEVRKIDQDTGEESIISDTPNEDGEHIAVEQYLERRLRSDKHLVFGSPGSEYWYGGRENISDENLNRLWDIIESQTDYRRDDAVKHTLQEGDQDYRIIPVSDFSDEEAAELTKNKEEEGVSEGTRVYQLNIDRLKNQSQQEDIDPKEIVTDEKKELLDPIPEVSAPTTISQLFFGSPSSRAAGTVTTSIGSNDRSVSITGVSGSGPYTVTLADASSAKIGDALWDEHATPRKYLITGISSNDLTVRDSESVGGAPDNSDTSTAEVTRYYSTITTWEADLDDTGVYTSSDDAVGEMYNDSAFDETVTINGGGTVGLNSIMLTVPSGERHDGTAGTGARIVRTGSNGLRISNAIPVDVEWLEVDMNGNSHSTNTGALDNFRYVRNCIVHGSSIGTLAGGIYGTTYVMNTIVYDLIAPSTNVFHGVVGINVSTGNGKGAVNNTIYNITAPNTGPSTTGMQASQHYTGLVENNIVVNCTNGDGDAACISAPSGSTRTVDYNAASDATAQGANSINSISASDQFISIVGGSEDLHLKAGADVIDEGIDLGTSPTGVNIDIDGRNRDAQGDTWDIGADEAPQLTISGTVYSDEGSTALTSRTVALAINGVATSTTTSHASTGTYSFSGMLINSGDILTVYIDGHTEEAVTVTKAATSNITGLDLYENHLNVRSDNGVALTNANLATAAVSDDDISDIYAVSSGNLTVSSGRELFVVASQSFTPGGDVTTPDLDVRGTYTQGTETLTVSNNYSQSSGTFSGGSGVIDVNNDFTLSGGTFTNSSGGMTIERHLTKTGGTYTDSGVITFNHSTNSDSTTFTCSESFGGTVVVSKPSNSFVSFTLVDGCTIDLGADPTSQARNIINNGVMTVSSGTWTVQLFDGTLTNNGTITHSGSDWTIEGQTSRRGSFVNSDGATVTYSGSTLDTDGIFTQSGTFDLSGKTITFFDDSNNDDSTLSCSGSLGGTVVITKDNDADFILASGCVVSLGASPTTALGTGQFSTYENNGTITVSSGTWTVNGSDNGNTNNFINNGTITHSGSGWDLNYTGLVNSSTGTITYAGSSITIGEGLTQDGTFDLSGKTITFDGTSSFDDGLLSCDTPITGDVVLNRTHSGSFLTLDGDCTIAGNFTRTDGPITNPASAYDLTVQGNFVMSTADTFGGANLTLVMGGGNTQAITQNAGTVAGPFEVNKSGGAALLSSAFTTGSTCNVVEGVFDINGQAFTCGSTFTVEDGGTFELFGNETPTTPVLDSGSTVAFTGDGDAGADAYTITSLATTYHHLTINSTDGATDTFSLGAAADINGNLTVTAGTFIDSGNTIALAGNWSNSGAYTGTGTVTFDAASGTQTLTSGGTGTGNDFQNITKAGGSTLAFATNAVDIDGTLTIDSTGIVDLNGQNITANTLANNGTFQLEGGETVGITTKDTDSGLVKYGGTGSYTTALAYGNTYYDLEFDGSGGVWEPDGAVTTNNNLTLTNGTFDIDGQDLTVTGTFSNNATLRLLGTETVSLTNDTNSGTISYDNSATLANFPANLDDTYYNLTLAGTGDVEMANDLTTNGSLTIGGSSTLDMNGFDLAVGGNLTNSGTLTGAGTRTITLTGATQTFNPSNISIANLLLTGSSGTVSLGSNFTVTTLLSIIANREFSLGNFVVTLPGDLANAGTITEGGSGYIAKSASGFYIANSDFDEDPAISLSVDKIYFSIMDIDGNKDGTAADTISNSVTVTCSNGGDTDSETVSLTETGAATGVFRYTAGITTGIYGGSVTQDDGMLECTDSDTITATYTDPQDGDDTEQDTATATNQIPPVAPSVLSGSTDSQTAITWSWTDNATGETGFKVYNASNNALIATIATPSTGTGLTVTYQETGLTAATTYSRYVVAYNVAGNSTASNTAQATTDASTPTAPTSCVATVLSATSVSVGWTDNASNETGFTVERQVQGAGTWSVDGSAAANATSYTSTGLSPSTAYLFRVFATNGSGNSSAATCSVVTTSTSDAPTSPTLVSPVNGATLTTIYPTFTFNRATDSDGIATYSLLINPTSDTTTISFSDISAGASVVLSRATVTATNATISVTITDPDIFDDGNTYSWKARAVDTGGATADSDIRGFSIDTTVSSDGSTPENPNELQVGTSSNSSNQTTTPLANLATRQPTITEVIEAIERGEVPTRSPEDVQLENLSKQAYLRLEKQSENLLTFLKAVFPDRFVERLDAALGVAATKTQNFIAQVFTTTKSTLARIGNTIGNRIAQAFGITQERIALLLELISRKSARIAVERREARDLITQELVETSQEQITNLTNSLVAIREQSIAAQQAGRNTATSTFLHTNQVVQDRAQATQDAADQIRATIPDITDEQLQRLLAFAQRSQGQVDESLRTRRDTIIGGLQGWQQALAKGLVATQDIGQKVRGILIAARNNRLQLAQQSEASLERIVEPIRVVVGRASLGIRLATDALLGTFDSQLAITNVTVEELEADRFVLTWKTTRLTTGKVNWGPSLAYGADGRGGEAHSDKLSHEHRVEITGLDPNTRIYFEVVSTDATSVSTADAYYSITTLSE